MYELALVETFREAFTTLWWNLQWWASVSFGVIAVATFGRDRLTVLVAIFLTVLYSLFTAYTFGNSTIMIVQVNGAIQALSEIQDSGELGAVGALTLRRFESPVGGLNFSIVFFACFVATYVGSVAYLWYSYVKSSKRA